MEGGSWCWSRSAAGAAIDDGLLPDCVAPGAPYDHFHANEATQGPSNLGGLGPDTGEEAMYLYDVGTSKDGQQIDMRITAGEGYLNKKPEGNGLDEAIADDYMVTINMKIDSTAEFTFTMYLNSTGQPYTLENVILEFFDFDQAADGKQQECVTWYNATDTEARPRLHERTDPQNKTTK